jgi:2-hydroxychromene-2-carboxylate isomerase
MAQSTSLRFYFDPACPWAWRTSLWIREAAKVRAIEVEWDFLSLQAINKGKDSLKDAHFKSEKGFRVMALLRRKYNPAEANQLIDKLYLELGQALHERKEDIGEDRVVQAALNNIGLDNDILQEAMRDSSTLNDLLAAHEKIAEQGGFGVPTLVLQNTGTPFKPAFGPVIDKVPVGEDAGELWDRVEWLIQRPEFFELKRSR